MKSKKRAQRKKKQYSIEDKAPKDTRTAPSTFEEISTKLRDAGWGRDELTQELEQAFCNIGVSYINLKPHFELLRKANEIFIEADRLMSWKELDGFIANSLFGRTIGCFLGAIRLSCSGQLTETWVLLRACIENSLYAFYIYDSLDHAKIWIDRQKNNKSKSKCKNVFRIGDIFNELQKKSPSISKEVKKFYEWTIDWGAHPNERSLFPNIVPKSDGSSYALRVLNADPGLLRATIIYTIKASTLIFKIFALIFPEVFNQPNLNIKIKNLNKDLMPLVAITPQYLKQSAIKKKDR